MLICKEGHWLCVCLLQTPHPEQEGPSIGTANILELLSTKEIAYHMTIHDWQLFICVQEVIDFNLLYFESKRERGWEEKKFWRGIEPWNEMAYKQVYLKEREKVREIDI